MPVPDDGVVGDPRAALANVSVDSLEDYRPIRTVGRGGGRSPRGGGVGRPDAPAPSDGALDAPAAAAPSCCSGPATF